MGIRPNDQYVQRGTGAGTAENSAGSDTAFYDLLSKERREQTVPIPELATQQFRKKMARNLDEHDGKRRSLSPKRLYGVLHSGVKRVRIKPSMPRLPSLPAPIMRIISRQRTVTISLEKEMVRVVVFKGDDIIAWKSAYIADEASSASVALPQETALPEAERGTAVQAPSPLQHVLNQLGIRKSGRIGQILNKFGVRRGRLIMDLSLYITLIPSRL